MAETGKPASTLPPRTRGQPNKTSRQIPTQVSDQDLSTPVSAFDQQSLALVTLLAQGSTLLDAKDLLKLDPETVSRIVSRPDFSDLIRSRIGSVEDVRTVFLANSMNAARVVVDVMKNSPDPKERSLAARDILDRAGVVPTKRIAVAVFNIDDEKRRVVAETLRELVG